MNRAGFQDLLAAADRGKFEVVVIYDISRGSRDVGDWFAFRKAMEVRGIQALSATQRIGDLTNPNDFLLELITVGIGQHDVSIDGVAVRGKTYWKK